MNNPATIFRSQNHAMHNSSSQISHFCSVEIKRKTSWDISIVNIVVIFLIVTRTLSNLSLEFAPHQQVLWFVPSNIAFQYPIWPAGGCQRCHEICNSDSRLLWAQVQVQVQERCNQDVDTNQFLHVLRWSCPSERCCSYQRHYLHKCKNVQKCKKQGWLRQATIFA